MSALLEKIKRFARSPQGQRAMGHARRTAADPRRRAQAQRFLSRLRTRR
ncbi:hypothetical protein [Streptomyces sp. NPDC057877]